MNKHSDFCYRIDGEADFQRTGIVLVGQGGGGSCRDVKTIKTILDFGFWIDGKIMKDNPV